LIIQQCAIVTRLVMPRGTRVSMGMIGFDIACKTARSGSRIQGYLVNDL
jgi:hypothetical protein